MATVTVRCHAELNDFLPRPRWHTWIAAPSAGHESVKNLIEALGVPHPEIAALRVNGEAVDFRYLVQPDDRVEVFPAGALPAGPLLPLRPPLAEQHFVLDTHLGRLAAYLRMLGYDTLYRNDYDDPELARLSHDEQRILLTRDIGLLKRSLVVYGAFVRSTRPVDQLREMVRRFGLHAATASFQRCIRCNGLTVQVAKAEIAHLLEPKTRQYFDEFRRCRACSQLYWRGSHYAQMQQLAAQVLSEA